MIGHNLTTEDRAYALVMVISALAIITVAGIAALAMDMVTISSLRRELLDKTKETNYG